MYGLLFWIVLLLALVGLSLVAFVIVPFVVGYKKECDWRFSLYEFMDLMAEYGQWFARWRRDRKGRYER